MNRRVPPGDCCVLDRSDSDSARFRSRLDRNYQRTIHGHPLTYCKAHNRWGPQSQPENGAHPVRPHGPLAVRRPMGTPYLPTRPALLSHAPLLIF